MTLKREAMPGSDSDENVMFREAILVSFGTLFGEMSRISEKCVFVLPVMENLRFPTPERHRKELKIGRILDRRFGNDFWGELRQKGYQNGSQIEEN